MKLQNSGSHDSVMVPFYANVYVATSRVSVQSV
jgi:hypothetical protein